MQVLRRNSAKMQIVHRAKIRYNERMPKKMEEFLRHGMQRLGRVVEKAIGTAKQAKATVVATGATPASVALETQFGIPKLKELLRFAVDRIVPSVIPTLTNRTVVEIAEETGRFALTCKEQGARLVAALELGAGQPPAVADATRQVYVIRGGLRRLPFADNFFDFGIVNLTTPLQGEFLRSLKEVSRILAPGAGLIVADFHPFGWFARRGATRIKPAESTLRGMGDYFKVARLAGLHVLDLREAFLDETMRAAFVTPEEKIAYRTLKESPLMVCLILRKGNADER